MSLGLRESLSSLVKAKFLSARASEALIFSHTELTLIKVSGLRFQLRYCPALAKKPKSGWDNQGPGAQKKKFDPFEDPIPALKIADVPVHTPTHTLVLNKFPIIPNHFILSTKAYKEQTHLLEEDDIALSYQCLTAWAEDAGQAAGEKRLFAFFNSGEHSGASQSHRHVQFLPVEDIKGDEHAGSWELLIDEIAERALSEEQPKRTIVIPAIPTPFVCFAAVIPQSPSSETLHGIYKDLYDAAAAVVHAYTRHNPSKLELHSSTDGSLPISYNLAMTTDIMLICPRKREDITLGRDDGSEVDHVAINGTFLGGTVMVKDEELWEMLKRDGSRMEPVLEGIGIPPEYGNSVVPSSL